MAERNEKPTVVLGATGSTGRRVAALLREAGRPVRAASRSGGVRFDWADRATWEPTVAGAGAMYLMAPHELPVDPEFVRCAVENGVRRLVLLSSMAIELMGDERLMAAERTVRESGAEWTIVRPNWFNQNFDEGVFAAAITAGELAVPVGELRQAFVDADDIAAVAATALVEDGHAGRSYEVTGPEALSFPDALALIGAKVGREIRFHGESADYVAAMTGFGVPREQVLSELPGFEALRAGGDGAPTDVVRAVTGRAPKPFTAYVSQAHFPTTS
ncbi:SDR family oxidoreductase [Allokutzneria sp. NRRL B-24872]|uniref:SDR family oxidoreductase n=1 Tax=Allokutzneria sp. NRRL B-24872 TaxID=1137961 RepID=UPI000A3BDCF9|nr:NAD(P)H-binding protein [Allokutzneria sp. NRRL B-24872]